MAPAGTPRPIIDRLNSEVQKALQLPAVRSRLEDMGGEAKGSTPEEMRAMVAAQTQKWIKVVADAKIPQQ
jgi:tripartite-type tricarboxylate transporter receptor subunit TctC